MAARQLADEAGHSEIIGWTYEMTAWFALTQGRYRDVIAAAQAGQAVDRTHGVHVQLIAQEAKAPPAFETISTSPEISNADTRSSTACQGLSASTTTSWSIRPSGTSTRWTRSASLATTPAPRNTLAS